MRYNIGGKSDFDAYFLLVQTFIEGVYVTSLKDVD